jgi:hypothetical protein
LTTWDNSDITRIVRNNKGNYKEWIYTVNGISGDTGGTLTTKFNHIEFVAVQMEVDTGPAGYAGGVAGLLYHIAGSTIVVAYTDPVDDHTIRITVTGR